MQRERERNIKRERERKMKRGESRKIKSFIALERFTHVLRLCLKILLKTCKLCR